MTILYKKFEKIDLSTERINNIINASYEVFANNSFEKASTNDIVKKANVSRGLLYHYFTDKEELFDFLIYYTIKIVVIDLNNNIDWNEQDVFSRTRQVILLKLQILDKYPFMFDFFEKHSEKINEESVLMKTEEISPGFMDKFYNYNLTYNFKREDTDIAMMVKVLNWTLTGVVKESLKNRKNIEEVLEKVDQYIAFLKNAFNE